MYDIKELLSRPSVQQALAEDEEFLYELYVLLGKESPKLTDFFLRHNINPFDYINEACEYMFEGMDMSIADLRGVVVVQKGAFRDCVKLESVIFDKVEDIMDGAFVGCLELDNVILPSTCKNIGEAAFAWCLNLKHIEIPESVENIGMNAFGGAGDLVIRCKENSAAHKYAFANYFKVELI
jgi:hypothetical protein